jgi:uncharacterized protein YcfL
MKKLILLTIAMAFLVIGCHSNTNKTGEAMHQDNTDNTTMDGTMDTSTNHEMIMPETEQLYACSMHPEVIGRKDEDCPQCGMKLTVPVKNSDTLQ